MNIVLVKTDVYIHFVRRYDARVYNNMEDNRTPFIL